MRRKFILCACVLLAMISVVSEVIPVGPKSSRPAKRVSLEPLNRENRMMIVSVRKKLRIDGKTENIPAMRVLTFCTPKVSPPKLVNAEIKRTMMILGQKHCWPTTKNSLKIGRGLDSIFEKIFERLPGVCQKLIDAKVYAIK